MTNREKALLLIENQIRKARKDFYIFRRFIGGKRFIDGWFQKEVCKNLMQFFDDFKAGKKPKLVIQAPPQHGKSETITDFITWLAGQDPNLKVIYASFSERLGIRANLKLQRMYDSEKYKMVFPKTMITEKNTVTISNQTLRNREILEYIGYNGGFRNTTVRGSITGESLDIGVIDDPIKGRAEANSETVRNVCWDWFTDDFFTRFSENAGLIAILTRWHVDDPIGRLMKTNENVKVLSYPAIATHDEQYRKEGDPLFPELKSLDFLLERKRTLSQANFEALYQQNPYIQGGEIFKVEYWKYWEVLPQLVSLQIFADTALKTKEQNDYSVFQLWGKSRSSQIYLIDQLRGKWEAPELLVMARSFYKKNNSLYGFPISKFAIEDKASGTGLIQSLKREGLPIVAIDRTIDKMTRAHDTVPLIQSGNVYLPKNANWLNEYLNEFSAFPNGVHDDQVDPTMDAVKEMLSKIINYGELL